MSNAASIAYSADMVQKLDPYFLDFSVVPDGSAGFTLALATLGYPVLLSGAAITQATVDAFLGSSSEIAATTAFGATAMGTDSMAFIVNMQNQVKSALWVESIFYASTRLFNYIVGQGTDSTVLANTLTQGFVVTSLGNIYGRIIVSGLDAATTPLRMSLGVYMK